MGFATSQEDRRAACGPAQLHRRWRALVVLGLLAGLTCGLAAAAVAGARRSEASWDRLRSTSLASDAIIFATQAGIDQANWAPVVALPYVEAAGAFSFGNLAEGDLLINQYGDLFTKVDRPRIIEGRLPRPDDPNEVVLERRNASTDADTPKFHVGQRITVHPLTQAEEEAAGPTGKPPTGPAVTLHVVGMAESPFVMAAIPSTSGGLFAGPAWRKAYPGSVQVFSNLVVRLHNPKTDIPKLNAAIARIFPGKGVPVFDLRNAAKRVTNGTGLESTGLLLFALAVAAAGMVIVGQALTRSVRAASGDLPALSAMGFDRAGAAGALALPHLVSAVTAVVTAVGLAIALSPRFPIGLGRRVDPDVGLHVDLPVVLGGALLVGLLLTTAVLVTAWRTSARTHVDSEARPSALVSVARRMSLPVPLVTGAGLALEAGRGRRSLPTRSALSGAAVGVIGLVGALVFLRGLDDAAAHPERFGAVWSLEASSYNNDPDVAHKLPATIAKDPDIAQVATVGKLQAPIGDLVVPIYTITPNSGPPLHFATLEGRGPRRSGEIALGPDTAQLLHVHVGDRIVAGDGHHFRVVGMVLLPTTPHSSFDQGAWILPKDAPAAIPLSVRQSIGQYFGADLTVGANLRTAMQTLGFVAGTTRPGADQATVLRRVQKAAGETVGVAAPSPSADQASMRNVRSLPILFGVFAPLVALAGLLHVSSSVLRRRGGDLAVLRALGLTPREAGACVAWQTTLLATLGLLVGAPTGYIIGRSTWRVVAEHTPMLAVVPTLTASMLLIAPAVLLAANIVGARPAWRVSHASAVEQLRAD